MSMHMQLVAASSSGCCQPLQGRFVFVAQLPGLPFMWAPSSLADCVHMGHMSVCVCVSVHVSTPYEPCVFMSMFMYRLDTHV
jgi:hypothetical protein